LISIAGVGSPGQLGTIPRKWMEKVDGESGWDKPWGYSAKFLQENEPVSETHFHLNGLAQRLILTQRRKVTQKWPLGFHLPDINAPRYRPYKVMTLPPVPENHWISSSEHSQIR